jgi:hypothetical protein
MGYTTQLVLRNEETENQDTRAKYGEVLDQFDVPTPRPFPDEMNEQYRRRALPVLQKHAPNFQNVRVDDARGSAFELLEKQIYEDASREARNPTQVPAGELKEMRRVDQAGRPYYEYFGSPSVWLSTFSTGKKRLIGIKTQTETGYHPSNVGANIIGTRY